MRYLKLVIWDLDETILTGILEEGDRDVSPLALKAITSLGQRGVLQAVATQNEPERVQTAFAELKLADCFVQVEADQRAKAGKVGRILEQLEIHPLDAIFVDDQAFERDSLQVQIPGLTGWSVEQLSQYLRGDAVPVSEESKRRVEIYREQQRRLSAEEAAGSYADFLRSCHIRITLRAYTAEDEVRTAELLRRTHRMNLSVLPVEEAVARLSRPGNHRVVIGELKDVYGDMGRCAVAHLTPDETGGAVIESLAISCRTRARGLSLAMLVGLLRHPSAGFTSYRCRYRDNGFNRPLRMLLMAAGFRSRSPDRALTVDHGTLGSIAVPDWVRLTHQT